MKPFESRASIRRELALQADADRLALAKPFTELACSGPLARDEVVESLSAYLLDPTGRAILATGDARVTWLSTPLFTWVGPGNAAPVDDVIAALVAAPALGKGTALSSVLLDHRFAPRADELVALAIAALDLPAQAIALEALLADPGPDPDLLGLSLVQCGRALAWAPHLLEWPVAEKIVDGLLARLHHSRPRPLIDAVTRALAPIATRPGPLSDKVRAAAFSHLDAITPEPLASFSAQVAAIGKARTMPDQDKWMALPKREVALASAYLLGFCAPLDRQAFVAHRARVVERPDNADLTVAFVDGLIAASHVPAVAELVAALLPGTEGEAATGLGIAAQIPLDDIRGELVARLDAPNAGVRAVAASAVELLANNEDGDIDASLGMRLGDPSPEVAAAATRTLIARGRRDVVAKHSAREPHPIRRAVVLAALGELSVPVIGELVRGTIDGIETDASSSDEDRDDVSPITRLLGDSLLCTVPGLDTAIDLALGVPDAVGLLALACVPGAERDVGILAPPAVRTRLAQATIAIAETNADTELGALALYLLARMSAGDETIAEVIADALGTTDGWAANLIVALGEVRVASERTGAALAPLVGPESPIGARVAAAAVCGRALPPDHAAWVHVKELLELGTIARAAAWSALRDRARRR